MSTSPDAIRADIEQTRRELGGDVDALADKVTPSKIVDRQTDKIRGGFGSLRNRIMGAAEDAGSDLRRRLIGRDVKDRVVAKAEGNPIAVGLIAFGVGLLAASLIPGVASGRRSWLRTSRSRRSRWSTKLKDAAARSRPQPQGARTERSGRREGRRNRCRGHRQGRGAGRDPAGQGPGEGTRTSNTRLT